MGKLHTSRDAAKIGETPDTRRDLLRRIQTKSSLQGTQPTRQFPSIHSRTSRVCICSETHPTSGACSQSEFGIPQKASPGVAFWSFWSCSQAPSDSILPLRLLSFPPCMLAYFSIFQLAIWGRPPCCSSLWAMETLNFVQFSVPVCLSPAKQPAHLAFVPWCHCAARRSKL